MRDRSLPKQIDPYVDPDQQHLSPGMGNFVFSLTPFALIYPIYIPVWIWIRIPIPICIRIRNSTYTNLWRVSLLRPDSLSMLPARTMQLLHRVAT